MTCKAKTLLLTPTSNKIMYYNKYGMKSKCPETLCEMLDANSNLQMQTDVS